MAQNGELDVTITGKSAHAGLYHLGIDSIMIASQIICQYQSIISRVIAPVESCVINIGEIQGELCEISLLIKQLLKEQLELTARQFLKNYRYDGGN